MMMMMRNMTSLERQILSAINKDRSWARYMMT